MCVINGMEGQFANRDDLHIVNVHMGLGNNTIPARCFMGCLNLTHITIPEGVIAIEDRAFANCINLQEIHLPNSITEIGESVFEGCQNLTTINCPENLARMPNNLGHDCSEVGMQNFREGFLHNKFEDMFAALERAVGYLGWRDGYRNAILHFSNIDWANAADAEVLELVARQDNNIANIGQGLVAIGGENAIQNHIQECREVVSHLYEIANAARNDNMTPLQINQQIDQINRQINVCREGFNQLFDARPHIIFNRLVVAAFANYVVPIPNENQLQRLADILNRMGIRYDNQPLIFDNQNCFILQHRIFESLSMFLPNRNCYELGCFAWVLSNADEDAITEEHFAGEALAIQQIHNILNDAGLLN